jgi:hypothetical protein
MSGEVMHLFSLQKQWSCKCLGVRTFKNDGLSLGLLETLGPGPGLLFELLLSVRTRTGLSCGLLKTPGLGLGLSSGLL